MATNKAVMTGHPQTAIPGTVATPITPTPKPAATTTSEPPAQTATTTSTPKESMKTLLGSPIGGSNQADRSELLLSNPNKFAESIIEDVVSAVENRDNRKDGLKKMWDEFYTENPDLKDISEEVESVLERKAKEWWDLPLDQAKKNLAEETRRRIARIKQFGAKQEVITSTTATALPSSGEPAPRVEVTAKPTGFVEEILEMKRKKRKV